MTIRIKVECKWKGCDIYIYVILNIFLADHTVAVDAVFLYKVTDSPQSGKQVDVYTQRHHDVSFKIHFTVSTVKTIEFFDI